jgi:protein-S-isoprenylcysteine O-methyltransferase Ste14
MIYRDRMSHSGAWLFRWRSYLPLVFLALLLLTMEHFEYWGDSHLLDLRWEAVCIAVSMAGLALRAYTVGPAAAGTSGRVTRAQEARTLNVTGSYSVVRNPLYLGNFLMWLGIAMFTHRWETVLIFVLAFWLYYERIVVAEESFLDRRFGEQFRRWAAVTPAFVPRLAAFRRPELPFSWRLVLRREHSGFFAVFAAMSLLEVAGDLAATGQWQLDPIWIGLFSGSFAVYLTLRLLKKQTRWLSVPGR